MLWGHVKFFRDLLYRDKMVFSEVFFAINGRPRLDKKRTTVGIMRDKDKQYMGNAKKDRKEDSVLRHFIARAFKQQARIKENYTKTL